MIELNAIRTKICEAIKQSGLTQTELAKRIGVVQQTINQYISGRALPALDTFATLCEILDLDANEILCIRRSESDRIKYSQNYFGNNIEVHNK
ncbi:MAG: helix-turn-helix transcriptional regulator [Clostridiales bacterium]|nr:helix-turn-helix transcriptional regulator [Clostridiales bacterium]